MFVKPGNYDLCIENKGVVEVESVGLPTLCIFRIDHCSRKEMQVKSWVDQVRAVAENVTSLIGVELVRVEYRPAGKRSVLRVVINREGGTGIQDCEQVSRALEQELDALNVIPGSYLLEVTSRGIGK